MKKILLTIFLIGVLSACEDVFEESPSNKYAETAVWSSIGLVDAFINETYNGVGNWVTDGMCLASMTDETYSMFNWAGEQSVGRQTMDANNASALGVNYNKGGSTVTNNQSGKWGYMYKKIRATNVFFENIDNLEAPQADLDRRKGEMHFLRAYFYAQLANVYSDVPLFTKSFKLEDDFLAVEKSPYQDVMDFVVSECDLAIALLPDPQSVSSEPGRATKGAAMALKAESLLYAASPLMNDGSYDAAKLAKAKTAHEDIIQTGLYSLHNDYRDIFLEKGNPEIIFAKYTNGDLMIDRENSMERDIAPNGTGGYTAYCPLQSLVDDFEVIDGASTFIPATWSGTTRTVTSNPLYNDDDPYVNRDPRFYASILFNGATRGTNGYTVDSWKGGKDSRQSTTTAYWNGTYTSYYLRKFSNEASDAYGDRPQTDVMWVHYRLGEIYLNLAEILFELNETDADGHDALWYVNEIRDRAGVPLYASVDREKIRHERRVEMVFEGNRFFDARRWMIYDQVMGKGYYGLQLEKQGNGTYVTSLVGVDNVNGNFNQKYYWWPIPQVEVNKNPSLGQSPGW